ncbi:DUF6320 domain-containing protein [Lachnospiraceae bacterium ZAX-1]
MSRCRQCKVTILDNTQVCPLCKSVLEQATDKKITSMYPNVKLVTRRLNFVVKLYTFVAIVLEAMLIIINYKTYTGVAWSAICGVAILYFYMTLRYSIQKNSGLKTVLFVQTVGAVIITICIDYIIGYRGWSIDFAIPCAILLMDLAIIVMMLINMENWQSYILLQMLMVLCSILMIILCMVKIVTFPILTFVAVGASVMLFIGTLIFGDRRAKNELKRRFHV